MITKRGSKNSRGIRIRCEAKGKGRGSGELHHFSNTSWCGKINFLFPPDAVGWTKQLHAEIVSVHCYCCLVQANKAHAIRHHAIAFFCNQRFPAAVALLSAFSFLANGSKRLEFYRRLMKDRSSSFFLSLIQLS